ncbi:MFS transporter [Paraburkholderia caribensis]|uniref:MFS transporter n=1 Tax=Paraburkholderia caribensis TaxID=75105 RepID=UPI001CB6346A|nr:MFS transporter [Paraburkholderia caribensis]CAG9243800.1 MFS domain-containing protein [Paraburkholderia caribensis]
MKLGVFGESDQSFVGAHVPGGRVTSADDVAARLERLPICSWHAKARLMLGVATFFDAFDALAIAQVLPVLVPMWKLTSSQVGILIAAGYGGQLAGALFFGWLAGRIGRLSAIRIAILVFAAMSVLCGIASSYQSLLIFRAIQGFGLGGEVPIAAVYISEITRAHNRGKFLLLYELLFTIGVFASGVIGTLVVPRFGWEYMFFIGAIPVIVVPFLAKMLPESPRWLAAKQRFVDAEKAVVKMEVAIQKATSRPLPNVTVRTRAVEPKASWRDYFAKPYGARTVAIWSMWFGCYIVYYGLGTWMPTLYRTVFKLPLEQSLHFALITNACGILAALLCVFTVDKVGRRPLFILSFVGCAAAFGWLYLSGTGDLRVFVVAISAAYFFATTSAFCVYVYTPECYPTRARAQGMGMATAWCRMASMIGPAFVGLVVKTGLDNVFLAFGLVSVVVGGVVAMMAPETSGRSLEEISP